MDRVYVKCLEKGVFRTRRRAARVLAERPVALWEHGEARLRENGSLCSSSPYVGPEPVLVK